MIFYLMLAIGAFFGLVFAQTPAVPFIFLNRRFYFRWCSLAIGYYLLMVTVCFYYYFIDMHFHLLIKFIEKF